MSADWQVAECSVTPNRGKANSMHDQALHCSTPKLYEMTTHNTSGICQWAQVVCVHIIAYTDMSGSCSIKAFCQPVMMNIQQSCISTTPVEQSCHVTAVWCADRARGDNHTRSPMATMYITIHCDTIQTGVVHLIAHDVHLVQPAIVVDELLKTARHGDLQPAV